MLFKNGEAPIVAVFEKQVEEKPEAQKSKKGDGEGISFDEAGALVEGILAERADSAIAERQKQYAALQMSEEIVLEGKFNKLRQILGKFDFLDTNKARRSNESIHGQSMACIEIPLKKLPEEQIQCDEDKDEYTLILPLEYYLYSGTSGSWWHNETKRKWQIPHARISTRRSDLFREVVGYYAQNALTDQQKEHASTILSLANGLRDEYEVSHGFAVNNVTIHENKKWGDVFEIGFPNPFFYNSNYCTQWSWLPEKVREVLLQIIPRKSIIHYVTRAIQSIFQKTENYGDQYLPYIQTWNLLPADIQADILIKLGQGAMVWNILISQQSNRNAIQKIDIDLTPGTEEEEDTDW